MTFLATHYFVTVLLAYAGARRLFADPIERILAAAFLVWAGVVLACLAASSLGRLGDVAWLFRTSLVASIALFAACRLVGPEPGHGASGGTRLRITIDGPALGLVLGYVATVGSTLLACVLIAVSYAPSNFDSLTYQLPRSIFYLGQGSLAHFDTPNARQIFFPFDFNLLQLTVFAYGGPTKAVTVFNLLAWVLAALTIFRVARVCGASRSGSLVASWIGVMATQVVAQAMATTNDLPAGLAALVAVLFAVRWTQERLYRYAVFAGMAAGLAVGSKLTVVFFVPAIAILLTISWLRRRRTPSSMGLRTTALASAAALGPFVLLGAPFALYNVLGAGMWMTNEFDFTLNRPFSLGVVFQTTKTYLVQMVFEPLQRFYFDPRISALLNDLFARTLFSNWNPAGAFSDLYVFPPDVNEDHVWFGFAGPYVLVTAAACAFHDRKLTKPATWLAVIAIGWFIAYFLLNKWSLYNQRYFVPAYLVASPCVAHLFDRLGGLRSPLGTGRLALVVVLATSVWFIGSYMLQNTRTPLWPLLTGGERISDRPKVPQKIVDVLSGKPRIHVSTRGANERIFPLLDLGRRQKITSGADIDHGSFGLISEIRLGRGTIFDNIPFMSSHVFIPISGKASAGVEYLGAIGGRHPAFDYFGLAANATSVPVTTESGNVLVSLAFARTAPDRLRSASIRIAGLNQPDAMKMTIRAESDSGFHHLATITQATTVEVLLPSHLKRIVFEILDEKSGTRRGEGAIHVRMFDASTPLDPGPPVVQPLLAEEFIGANPGTAFVVTGLAPLEGPYPQWRLPLFRWAKQPAVRIVVPANAKANKIMVSFAVRLHVRDEGLIEVLHNGTIVDTAPLHGREVWLERSLVLDAKSGDNIVELRDASGTLPPESLYFVYRSLRVEVREGSATQ